MIFRAVIAFAIPLAAMRNGTPVWVGIALWILAAVWFLVWARVFLGRGEGRWTPFGRREMGADDAEKS